MNIYWLNLYFKTKVIICILVCTRLRMRTSRVLLKWKLPDIWHPIKCALKTLSLLLIEKCKPTLMLSGWWRTWTPCIEHKWKVFHILHIYAFSFSTHISWHKRDYEIYWHCSLFLTFWYAFYRCFPNMIQAGIKTRVVLILSH